MKRVVLLVAADLAHQEHGVDDDAGDDQREGEDAEDERQDAPPVDEDPADVEGDRGRDEDDAEDDEDDRGRRCAGSSGASRAGDGRRRQAVTGQARDSGVAGTHRLRPGADWTLAGVFDASCELRRDHRLGSVDVDRVVGLLRHAVDVLERATLTSHARPSACSVLMPIQLKSNSYQARPWRADTGCAWWLLCQPSPKREQRHPPVVGRVVARLEAARAPEVRRRVHQPGAVQAEGGAEEDAPEHVRDAAKGEQREADDDLRHPVPVGERTRGSGSLLRSGT